MVKYRFWTTFPTYRISASEGEAREFVLLESVPGDLSLQINSNQLMMETNPGVVSKGTGTALTQPGMCRGVVREAVLKEGCRR